MKPDWLVGVGANSMVSQVQSLKAQAKEDLSVLVQKTYLEAQQAIDEVIGLESSIRLAKENLDLREKESAARFRYLLSLTKLLALSSEMNSFNQYQSSAYQPTQEASL